MPDDIGHSERKLLHCFTAEMVLGVLSRIWWFCHSYSFLGFVELHRCLELDKKLGGARTINTVLRQFCDDICTSSFSAEGLV